MGSLSLRWSLRWRGLNSTPIRRRSLRPAHSHARSLAGLRDERGAGSALALALLGATLTLLLTTLPLFMALSARQALAGAADAAALAAADVASGLLPGFPCGEAERVARANGASLDACEVDGLVATVRVGGAVLGIRMTALATAGPPP